MNNLEQLLLANIPVDSKIKGIEEVLRGALEQVNKEELARSIASSYDCHEDCRMKKVA